MSVIGMRYMENMIGDRDVFDRACFGQGWGDFNRKVMLCEEVGIPS